MIEKYVDAGENVNPGGAVVKIANSPYVGLGRKIGSVQQAVLYLGMAVAAWLVWRQKGMVAARVPLALFAVQLGLNVLWSWLFFGLRNPGLGVLDILLLWIAIAATIAAFWKRSLAAGLLLVPYLAWVSFAAVLNFAIWRLNG